MSKAISTKITALTFGILVISFFIAFYAIAWQEPVQSPPDGNVPAPINIGSEPQEKEGPLTLNTICIGEDCRESWPATGVVTTYHLEASSYQVDNEYFADSSSFTCPDGSNVVNIYLSERNVHIQSSNGGGCIWGCQAGMCGGYDTNSCSYSINGSIATLRARVLQGYHVDCECCTGYSLVDYCYPHSVPPWNLSYYTCHLPSGSPQCIMEFQCGIKETVED